MKLQLEAPQRGTSWPSLIGEIILPGDKNGKPFPIEKERQLRTTLSATIKPRYPERVYSANKRVVEGTTVLWIYLEKYIN